MIPDDIRRRPMWEIATEMMGRSGTPEETYVDLKNRVFPIQPGTRAMLASEPPPEGKDDEFIADYVHKVASISSQNHNDAQIGLDLIREFKTRLAEPDDLLTEDHSLAARVCNPSYNIVLFGPTGSGKTHKIEYVWRRYIRDHSHCGKCDLKRRIRIRVGVDLSSCRDSEHFSEYLFDQIIDVLENKLGKSRFREHFTQCLTELRQRAAAPQGDAPQFFHVLNQLGLEQEEFLSPSDIFQRAGQRGFSSEALLLALHLAGWITRKHCDGHHGCLFLVLDNVDGAPPAVQRAIVGILENTDPSDSVLLVCACRLQTLKSWQFSKKVVDTVEHIGPTAYEIVMTKLDKFLAMHSDLKDGDDKTTRLASELQHARRPEDFIFNLAVLRDELRASHFRELFDSYFHRHVRAALLLARSVVDIAASQSRDDIIRLTEDRSVYALERRIYRPWGFSTPPAHVLNVFALGDEYERRLSGIRALRYMRLQSGGQCRLGSLVNYLRMFGYGTEELTGLVNRMLKVWLITARTKDGFQMESVLKYSNEPVVLTEVGRGLADRWANYNYLSAVMLFAICTEAPDRRYPRATSHEKADDMGLLTTLQALTVFLTETSQLEYEELSHIAGRLRDYRHVHGNSTLTNDLYESITPTVVRIGRSDRLPPKVAQDVLRIADAMVANMLEWNRKLRTDRSLEPYGLEYMPELKKAIDFLSSPQRPSTDPGGGGGGHTQSKPTQHPGLYRHYQNDPW